MTSDKDSALYEAACQDLQITDKELDAIIKAGFRVTSEFQQSTMHMHSFLDYTHRQTHIMLIESRTNGVTGTMHPREVDVTHQVRSLIQSLREI